MIPEAARVGETNLETAYDPPLDDERNGRDRTAFPDPVLRALRIVTAERTMRFATGNRIEEYGAPRAHGLRQGDGLGNVDPTSLGALPPLAADGSDDLEGRAAVRAEGEKSGGCAEGRDTLADDHVRDVFQRQRFR